MQVSSQYCPSPKKVMVDYKFFRSNRRPSLRCYKIVLDNNISTSGIYEYGIDTYVIIIFIDISTDNINNTSYKIKGRFKSKLFGAGIERNPFHKLCNDGLFNIFI